MAKKLFEKAGLIHHPLPVSPERRSVKIMYVAQIGVAPPTFVFFTNVATVFHFSYQRFVANQLRETFGFDGVPIKIVYRERRRGGRGELVVVQRPPARLGAAAARAALQVGVAVSCMSSWSAAVSAAAGRRRPARPRAGAACSGR